MNWLDTCKEICHSKCWWDRYYILPNSSKSFMIYMLCPLWCCALFCLTFHEHTLGGSYTGRVHHFSRVVYVLCGCVIVINFVYLTYDSLTTIISGKPIHVVFLQNIKKWFGRTNQNQEYTNIVLPKADITSRPFQNGHILAQQHTQHSAANIWTMCIFCYTEPV